MTIEEKLHRLEEDTEALDKILAKDSEFNYFRVLQISHLEVYHSNFLAWLLDPHGSHHLAGAPLEQFFAFCGVRRPMDFDSFIVKREWFDMDVLAISDVEKYILCIENKMETGEHTNQLRRYQTTLERYYPEYEKHFIYLTPDGKTSSDQSRWHALSYENLFWIIQGIDLANCDLDEAAFIRHYQEAIRRDIVGDEELKALCQRIYVKHRTALNLLIDHRPRPMDAYKVLMCWAEDMAEKGEIHLDHQHTDKSCIRFTTDAMTAILPNSDEPVSLWHTSNHYYYEFWVKKSEHDFFLQIDISPSGMTPAQKDIFARIMELRRDYQDMEKKRTHNNPFVSLHQDFEGLPDDDIWMHADEMFQELREFEKDMAEALKT